MDTTPNAHFQTLLNWTLQTANVQLGIFGTSANYRPRWPRFSSAWGSNSGPPETLPPLAHHCNMSPRGFRGSPFCREGGKPLGPHLGRHVLNALVACGVIFWLEFFFSARFFDNRFCCRRNILIKKYPYDVIELTMFRCYWCQYKSNF